tara:strand:+ start:190 stop:357 length:168 start_codon:yes stop_codon:yes gene_type:complete
MRIVIAMNLSHDNQKPQCDNKECDTKETLPRRGRWARRRFFKNSYDYSIIKTITI